MKKITFLLLVLLTSLSWRSTAQFFEGFESGIPASWTVINGGDANTWVHFTNAIFVHEGTGVAAITYSATAHDDYLITPPITVTANVSDRFSFFARSFDPAYPENFDLKISTTTPTAGAFTTTLANIAPDSNLPAFTQYTFDLTPYIGQTIYIGMHSTTTDMWRISVDNVVSDAQPTCVAPTALTASNITTTSADLSWTPDASGSAWNVEWGMAPLTQGSGTVITGATNPQAISGLASGASYSYYVQTNCGAGVSAWAGPYTFSTLCDTSVLPYSLNFNEVTVPALPNCTENVNEGTGNNWTTAAAPTTPAGLSGNVLRYKWNSANPANTWFFTNGLNLTGGTSYSISYKYAGASTSWPESMKVAYGTSKTGAAMTNVIADYPSIADATVHTAINTFTPATSGVYYIGYQAYSATDMFYLYVDDIEVYVTPTCPAPTAFTQTDFDATTSTFSWTAGGSETSWEIVYGATGFDPAVAGTTFTVSASPHTITGLTDGNGYDAYIRAVCGASNNSTFVGPISWTAMDAPDCASNPTPSDAATNVPVGTVMFMWDPAATGGPAVSYKMYYGLTPTTVTNFVGNFTDSFVNINLSGYSTTFYWMIVPVNAAGEATGCAIWSFTTVAAPGYCLNAPYGVYPDATFTPSVCDGVTPEEIVTDGWAGEYSNVQLTAGYSYQFTSSVATDFITISDATGTTPLVYGVTPVTYAPTADEVVRFYTHTNDQCGTAAISRTRAVVCTNTVSLSDNIIDGFIMYPNPVNSTLNISAINKIEAISIFNMLGQEVLRVNPNATQVQLDLNNLTVGSYVVKVQSDTQLGAYNLIKQ